MGKGRVRSTTQPVVSLPSSFVLSYMHGPGLSVARNHKGVNRESSRTRPLPLSWKAKMESPRSHSAGSWVQEMPKTLKEENRPLKLEDPWAQERETNPRCSFLSPLHQLVQVTGPVTKRAEAHMQFLLSDQRSEGSLREPQDRGSPRKGRSLGDAPELLPERAEPSLRCRSNQTWWLATRRHTCGKGATIWRTPHRLDRWGTHCPQKADWGLGLNLTRALAHRKISTLSGNFK